MDRLTKEKRSWNMSMVRSANTKPEKQLRALLHAAGYRFRIHVRKLPGSPDIVLPKYKTAIFVHGCFWHRHDGCKYAYKPKSRLDFWEEKFKATVERDLKKSDELRSAGWRVIVVWECELEGNVLAVMHKLHEELKGEQNAP